MPIDSHDGKELKPEIVHSSRRYHVQVLVCAPSKSALDEIELHLLNTGVRDENVRSYTPKLVRNDLKAHHSVNSVAMDHLVKQKRDDLASDKQKQGATKKDRDNIRSAILNEAVIVGDPVQLPATIISPVAENLGYGTSLFKRLQRAGYPVGTLKT